MNPAASSEARPPTSRRGPGLCTNRASRRQPLLFVVAIAVFVQAIYILDLRDDPTFDTPIIDARTYHRQAQALAHGQPLAEGAFWQPPLYPALLGAAYGLAGPGAWTARLLGALVFVATCALTCRLARRLFGGVVAATAGALLALHGPSLFFSQQLLPASLAALLNVGALNLLVAARRSRTGRGWPAWLAFGGAAGLSVLCVANSIVLLAVGAMTLLWRMRGRRAAARYAGRGWRCAAVWGAAALTGFGAVVLPVSWRNYVASGEWVWVAANGGVNFHIGNGPDREERLAIRPGEDWDRLMREPIFAGATTAAQKDRYFYRRAMELAGAEPAAFISGFGWKLLELFNSRETPRNEDVYDARTCSGLLGMLIWKCGPFGFPWGLLAPLAVFGWLGACTGRRRQSSAGRLRRMLGAHVALFGVTLVLFFPCARYRIPFTPLLLIFSASGLIGMTCAIRSRRAGAAARRSAGRGVVAALTGFAAVNLPLTHPTDGVNFQAEKCDFLGYELEAAGNLAGARDHYLRATQLDAGFLRAWCDLGRISLLTGESAQVAGCVRRAMDLQPLDPQTLRLSGDWEVSQGRWAVARRYYEQAIAADPGFAPGHQALALLDIRDGRPDEAEASLREVLRFGRQTGRAAILLADILVDRGAYAEALTLYHAGLSQVAREPGLLNRVAWLLATCPDASLRDGKSAVRLAEEAIVRVGEDASILNTLAAAYLACDRGQDAASALRRGAAAAERAGDSDQARRMSEQLRRLESSGAKAP